MESVFSLTCINGVIDHSGNSNISTYRNEAWLKLYDVKAEMHLDDFILQSLPGDSYISFPSHCLYKWKGFEGRGMFL